MLADQAEAYAFFSVNRNDEGLSMPTFMSEQTLYRLAEVRRRLIHDVLGSTLLRDAGPQAVFVPWSGRNLADARGNYYVGIALAPEEARDNRSFQESLMETEAFCGNGPHGRGHTPFWRFLTLTELTQPLLGGTYDVTSDRWGWSNLLKIGWSEGAPVCWPCALKDAPGEDAWHKEHELDAGVWWHHSPQSGNLHVHGYHPHAARMHRFFDKAVDCTVHLAREKLPSFAE